MFYLVMILYDLFVILMYDCVDVDDDFVCLVYGDTIVINLCRLILNSHINL